MTPQANADSSWDRVAAELRACREAQQRAWGDIDNTTLGRFLAGEVTPEEQHQIENALDNLPELRKLTELVREVLAEPETAPVPCEAAVLPFPPPQPQARTLVPSEVPGGGWRTPGTVPRKVWFRDAHFRRCAGLAAAACLLLALGVALPRTKTSARPEAGVTLAFFHPVADRRLPIGTEGMVEDSVLALEVEGKNHEAVTLARQYANNLTRQARVYQEKGDLGRAEPALNQARLLCARTFGPEAPETVRARNSLAGVYEVALNTASSSPNLDALVDSPSPRFTSADRKSTQDARGNPPRLMAKASALAGTGGSANTALSPPVHSASAYVAPSAPVALQTTSPHAQKPKSVLPSRHQNHLSLGEQSAAFALCQRITHQSQKEVKTAVVPVLIQALRESNDAAERQRFACALGRLGPAAAEAVPVLLDAYRGAALPSERAVLLLALGQIGSAARQAVPVLVDSLRSDDPQVRKCAAHALVLCGSGVRGRDGELVLRNDADPLLREVLKRLDSPEGRSGIDDAAECFSIEAIQQGRQAVLRLARQTHLEIRIETVHGENALKKRTANLRREAGSNCVHLCIDKDAPAVQVFVSEPLRKQGLTEAKLHQAMAPYLRGPDFDRALEAGIHHLDDFETNLGRK